MRKILLVALTAAAMVSCSENEGFENESTMNRIKFGTVVKTGTKTLVATTENFSKFRLSGNIWLVSFKISYLCLPLFYETRTTPSCHPSGCAYRQL